MDLTTKFKLAAEALGFTPQPPDMTPPEPPAVRTNDSVTFPSPPEPTNEPRAKADSLSPVVLQSGKDTREGYAMQALRSLEASRGAEKKFVGEMLNTPDYEARALSLKKTANYVPSFAERMRLMLK